MSIRQLISTDSAKNQIAAALPEHMTADRQVRVALTALNKSPRLQECTQASFIESLMTCSELGLEPNGRHAHLIPYGNKCQLIVDYKGLIELAFRSGKVEAISADVVYVGDMFDYQTCGHVPWAWRQDINKPDERGDIIGVFCLVSMVGGAVHRERMTLEDVKAIRDRSRAGTSGPWVTDFEEMAKKTVFRRASKWIPQCPHLDDALSNDGDSLNTLNEASSTVQTTRTVMSSAVAAALESNDAPETSDDTENDA